MAILKKMKVAFLSEMMTNAIKMNFGHKRVRAMERTYKGALAAKQSSLWNG
jgi:hypothetical protein